MANTNKVPDINLEIHRTSRLNSGENEGIKCNFKSQVSNFLGLKKARFLVKKATVVK